MPLLTGNWSITINGHESTLSITSISGDGRVDGLLGGAGFSGFWNEAAQMIVMQISGSGPILTGYLFTVPAVPPPGGDVKWNLCGYVTVAPDASNAFVNPNSRRMIFGWRAEITQVI